MEVISIERSTYEDDDTSFFKRKFVKILNVSGICCIFVTDSKNARTSTS